jgi:hypothetical protein
MVQSCNFPVTFVIAFRLNNGKWEINENDAEIDIDISVFLVL